jgi:hypothetical protein
MRYKQCLHENKRSPNGGQNIPHHNLPEVQPELLGPYQAGYTRFWAQPQEPEKNATGPAIVKSHLDEIRS